MLFKFGKVISPICSFCKLHKETIIHPFCDRLIVKRTWNQPKSRLSKNINFLKVCHRVPSSDFGT